MRFIVLAIVAATTGLSPAESPPQTTPKPSETYTVECTFSNPAYSGHCGVSEKVPGRLSPGAACQNVLSCLNNSQCSKTYCNSTTVRGGWKLESAKRQHAK